MLVMRIYVYIRLLVMMHVGLMVVRVGFLLVMMHIGSLVVTHIGLLVRHIGS